jgi:hypothetical protein
MMRLAEPPHQHTGANIPEIEFVVFCFIAILLMMWLVLERD